MQISATIEEAFERITPMPVYIALARDATGKYNPITLAWCMRCSHKPPLLACGVHQERHTYEAIRHSREFVVAFAAAAQGVDAVFFGTHSGHDMDKLAERKPPVRPATEIKSMILENAVVNFECVLESELETGDHTIFVGRVVAAHVNDEDSQGLFMLPGSRLGAARETPEDAA